MCNKYYNNNQYYHESPCKKILDFPRNTRDYSKSFKGDSHKEEASARCWESKFTASSLSNNVNASALAEFHASLL